MTSFNSIFLAAALAAAPALGAQTSAEPSNFRPLEFLIGHCWIGTFPDGKQTDEHCFEWMYGGKFVRDRHIVRGGAEAYEGESTYSWDPKAKRINFAYYNTAGEVTSGYVEETAEGIVFPQKHQTATGTMELKTVWTRPSPDSYRVWVGQKKGADWKVLWTMDLKQK
jgi:hypothetical protein